MKMESASHIVHKFIIKQKIIIAQKLIKLGGLIAMIIQILDFVKIVQLAARSVIII